MDGQPLGEPWPELSIVVPALNEEGNVGPLVEQVKLAVIGAGIEAELIVVDDGSSDGTLVRLRELASSHSWLRVLHRTKPMGQSAALHAGIAASRGRFVATLDADLQNDPTDLVRLLALVRAGHADMAQGLRIRRNDSPARKFSSWVGRTTRRLTLGDTIYDTGCSTRVVRAEIAQRLPLQFKGMHRFLPLYARMLGARVIEVPVNHRPRHSGVAKYGMWNRALCGLIDCFAVRWMRNRLRDTSCRPIHCEEPRYVETKR
jgi:glycosyltransferase involved in cell wall biosynthesis